MKSNRLLFIFLIFICGSACQTIKDTIESIKTDIEESNQERKEQDYLKAKDGENWDLEILDTAESEEYLTYEEKNIILELNKVRTDPKKYSELYLKPLLSRYSGKEYSKDGITIITKEGIVALRECINVLNSIGKCDVLSPDIDLFEIAKKHVELQGPTGKTGHDSPDGTTFQGRFSKLKGNYRGYGENISYGKNYARDIIISLLIDDGVPSRGHRKNIMQNKFNVVGTNIGNHQEYGVMCVIDFGIQ